MGFVHHLHRKLEPFVWLMVGVSRQCSRLVQIPLHFLLYFSKRVFLGTASTSRSLEQPD
jgi:hypothetical protein